MARCNTTGNVNWFKQLYGLKPAFNSQYSYVNESCESVAIAPDGRIGLGGYTNGGEKLVIKSGAGTIDTTFITSQVWDTQQRYGHIGIVMQWDAAGSLLWLKDNLNGINSGRYWTTAQNLATNAGGELYIAAETMSKTLGAGAYTPKIFKYSASGTQLWGYSIPTYMPGTFVGYPATNPRVAFAEGRAYLSEKNVRLLNTGIPDAQLSRVHCFNDFGTLQWTSVYTSTTGDIYALAAKQTAYTGGITGSSSFGNLTVTCSAGTDGCVAKLQFFTPPVQPLAFSAVTPDKNICTGGSAALAPGISVTGGVQPYTYSWAPAVSLSNATALNPTATPGSTTQYTLTVSDAQGWLLRDTVMVNVQPQLAKPTVQLIAGISPSVYDTLVCTSPATGLSYDWRNSFNAYLGNTAKLLIFKGQSERFRVTITNGLSGCSATSDVFYYYMVKANAGNDTTVCQGQPVTLGGTPPYFGMPGGNVTYHWASPAAGLFTGTLQNPYITISPAVTADYILYIEGGGGSPEIYDTVRITVNARPNLGPDTLIYHNCYAETTNLLTLYNTTGLTAVWNTGTPAAAPPGNYRLIATNAAGCADTAFVTVKLEVAKWTGALSSDWHTAGNWNINQVPAALTHVIISSGTPNPCVISTANGVAASVQLRNGAVLSTANGMTITITGNCAILPPD